MGGRGASSASSRRAGARLQSVTLNRGHVVSFMDDHSASEFTGDAPKNIEVGGVGFHFISQDSMVDNRGRTTHYTSYQSDRQSRSGEYPLIEVVVRERRRGRRSSYEYDSSLFGTRLI